MFVTSRVERIADGSNSTVHHVGRRYHVGASVGLGDRHSSQNLNAFIVHDVAVDHNAVVTVGAIRIECHIRNDQELRNRGLDRSYSP